MLKILHLTGIVALIVATSTAKAADVKPNAIHLNAMKQIESDARGWTKVAYITSKSHTSATYVEGKVYDDGSFTLTYKFSYRDSDGDAQSYTLRFPFSKLGVLSARKFDDIGIVAHTSVWPPFNAAKIAGMVLEEALK